MERENGRTKRLRSDRNIMKATYGIQCFLVATLIPFGSPEKDAYLSEKVSQREKGKVVLQLELYSPVLIN